MIQQGLFQARAAGRLLDHKKFIEQYLRKSVFRLSAFSFVSIFIWSDFFDFNLKVIDENLCIFAENSLGRFMYLPPLGDKITDRTIQESFNYMEKLNGGSPVTRIENVGQEELSLFDPKLYSFYKKSDEYLYRREDIATFKGNRYKSKRSSYNYFVKHHRFEYLPFEEDMKEDCLRLYDQWQESRRKTYEDKIYQQMLEDNRSVHGLGLSYFRSLGLIGRVVKVEGQIKAYSFGYVLNEEIYCILFEIADFDIKGLPTYIFSEFCRDKEIEKFNRINAMDDFGMKNIATTKLSFRPCEILPCYTVTRKKI